MSAVPSPLALKPVVLASSSKIRAELLRNAGVEIEVRPSGIDESAVIAALTSGKNLLPPADVASVLAQAKAEDVAGRYAGLVIGADQTLELDGKLFRKPATVEEARRNLLDLSGRTHLLHSAAVLIEDGETVWQQVETVSLTMRRFTPRFLGRYLALAGDDALKSVGAYRLEGPGAQLFAHIEGDFFTVLGLPLLPLLEELRRCGVLVE